MTTPHKIAVIGGTGPQGKGLAYRFAAGGHSVVIGSRSASRADGIARDIGTRLGNETRVTGVDNVEATQRSEIVVLAVPYEGYADLVRELRRHLTGKPVISCINPIGFDDAGPFGLEFPGGSAAEEAQQIAPEAHVVGAFHHLSARTLWRSPEALEDDVLVCGDSIEAKEVVTELVGSINGRHGVDVGRLRIARQLEPLTAALISINKRYKTHAGIRITGLREA